MAEASSAQPPEVGVGGEFSDYLHKRVKQDNPDDFERNLYQELERRLHELRHTGPQIPLVTFRSWLLPVLTVAVIVIVYFAYILPKM